MPGRCCVSWAIPHFDATMCLCRSADSAPKVSVGPSVVDRSLIKIAIRTNKKCIVTVNVGLFMITISHRGYWKTAAEKNTVTAFDRSFSLGYGTETDLRDLGGQLVVSHDPPAYGAMSADDLFAQVAAHDPNLVMALNIKADGLQALVSQAVARHGLTRCFVFDMSVPDAVQWLKTDIAVYTRHSDVEESPALYDEAKGVWLDSFHSDWWEPGDIAAHLDAGKQVAVVSPELHGRDHAAVWHKMRESLVCESNDVILCTDIPETAKEFFRS